MIRSSTFHKIMQFIFEEEGGYVNHPSDPGGETNYGITKRSYPNVDIKNLTKLEALDIYYKDYWETEWEKLGFPLAACMMDTSVNMGKKRARYFLQQCGGDYVNYLQQRIAKYKELIELNPKLKAFEKGWMARVTRLRRYIETERSNTLPSSGVRVG